MGAALQILWESESARAERKGQEDGQNARSNLFNLSDPKVRAQNQQHVAHPKMGALIVWVAAPASAYEFDNDACGATTALCCSSSVCGVKMC